MSRSNSQSEEVSVVRAGKEHLDSLAALFDAYRVFYEQPSDPGKAREFLAERLGGGDSVIYLATGERGALGFTQLYPTFSSVSMRPMWILNDLYVVPDERKQGVARALIDRARQLAVETGAKGVILETAIDNDAAQRLYDKYGFVRDTEFHRYFLSV